MLTETAASVMRSRWAGLLSRAASHDGPQEFPASPYRTGWSFEPPVVVRIRIQAPVGRRQAMRYLALEIIGQGSGRPGRQKSSDLPINIPLPRSHEGIEDAP